MNNVTLARWPGGKSFAVTFSYDDGHAFDRRLVALFNKYGVKGTFNLNSGFLGRPGYIAPEEQHPLGGYNIWRSPGNCLEPAAEGKIKAAAIEMLKALDTR